jgi:predicted DsbA family dithiol-disulfide isomerase
MTETLSVYSDFVCPFCYLGRESLREYVDESTEPPDVQWELFDLRGYKRAPDGSIQDDVDDGKDEDYFDQVRENVARLQEEYDAEMVSLDTIGEVDSWNAQQAALFVRQTEDEETFTAFYDAVFDALWQEGRDIGDPDVLSDIAEGVGIDPDAVRDATEDPQLESELKSEFEAAQKRGITGIPTFVYDGHAARGAVPPEHLKRLVGET